MYWFPTWCEYQRNCSLLHAIDGCLILVLEPTNETQQRPLSIFFSQIFSFDTDNFILEQRRNLIPFMFKNLAEFIQQHICSWYLTSHSFLSWRKGTSENATWNKNVQCTKSKHGSCVYFVSCLWWNKLLSLSDQFQTSDWETQVLI